MSAAAAGVVGVWVVALLLSLSSAPRAEAILYWSGHGGIQRANLDGTQRSDAANAFGTPSLGFMPAAEHVCGLAVNSTHIYWGDLGTSAIGRANLDGSQPNNWFVTGMRNPCLLAIGSSHIFWTTEGSTSISRANLDGGNPDYDFVEADPPREIYQSPYWDVCGGAVDGSHLYWAHNRAEAIGRVTLDGSTVEPEFIPDVGGVCGVAVTGSHLYWGSYERSIGRATIDGAQLEPTFIAGLERPCGLALDSTHLYWREQRTMPGSIGRVELGGGGPSREVLTNISGGAAGCEVAVDSLSLPSPTPSPPVQSSCRVGKANVGRRRPVAYISLFAPVHGEIDVLTRGLRSKLLTPPPPPSLGGRRWVSMKVWLARNGRIARRLRERLSRTGKAAIVLRIQCQGVGEVPGTTSKRLVLRRFLRVRPEAPQRR
jgi:hypothetical protein